MAEQTKPLLEQFRGSTKRLVIHPYERAALAIVGAQLVLLPWALGGVRVWAQAPSLLLALLGFVIALLPREYTEDHTGSERFRLIMWPKLVRFPLFWLGLVLLAWVTISALNPAFQYETDGKTWWMKPVEHLKWLPASVRVPFERYGPWRLLVIYSTTWLVVCTVWVAFTRRRTLQLLFIAIAINGALLAVFGLAERMLPNGKMFWFVPPPRDALWFGSFIYKNHGGAYLDLALAVMCGLAAWYHLRGLRRLEKSNPSGLFAFLATVTSVAILTSYARGATVAMLAFLVIAIGAFVLHQLMSSSEHRKPVVAIALIVIFSFFLKTGWETMSSRQAWTRMERGIAGTDNSLSSRRVATTATLDLAKDYWPVGSGSGSFRFLFPPYQRRYPAIATVNGHWFYWEHAHDDPVEFLAEYGVFGIILALAAFGWWAVALVRSFFWSNPLTASLVLGLVLLAIYSAWDFPFQCASILMLWWVLLALAPMWASMEEQNLKG